MQILDEQNSGRKMVHDVDEVRRKGFYRVLNAGRDLELIQDGEWLKRLNELVTSSRHPRGSSKNATKGGSNDLLTGNVVVATVRLVSHVTEHSSRGEGEEDGYELNLGDHDKLKEAPAERDLDGRAWKHTGAKKAWNADVDSDLIDLEVDHNTRDQADKAMDHLDRDRRAQVVEAYACREEVDMHSIRWVEDHMDMVSCWDDTDMV